MRRSDLYTRNGSLWTPRQVPSQYANTLWIDPTTPVTISGVTGVTAYGSPPASSVSGTPTGIYNFRSEIVTGGARGVATFKYRTSPTGDWSAPLLVDISVPLGSTGVTQAFGTGTFTTSHAWTFDTTISQWTDISGLGHHAVMGTAANQPPAVASDPNQGFKRTVTMGWARRLVSTYSIPAPCTMFVNGYNSSAGGSTATLLGFSNGSYYGIRGCAVGENIVVYDGSVVADGPWTARSNAVAYVRNGASSSIQLNTRNVTPVALGASATLSYLSIGASSYQPGYFLYGNIASVLVFNGAMPAYLINRVLCWMAYQCGGIIT